MVDKNHSTRRLLMSHTKNIAQGQKACGVEEERNLYENVKP
jgi:hypothetical protein